ncbi:Alpha/Beta hydrolase protein [Mycena epipterygia]|nr:Alpha/Beta hydrolase protein [Mycena epipterygia]
MSNDFIFQYVGVLPNYSDARFSNSDVVEAHVACRSYDTYTTDSFIRSVSLANQTDSCISTGINILVSPSPNGSTKAVFREDSGILWLEILSESGISKRELKSFHGQIYTDPSFGPLGGSNVSWNEAGTQFLYVAETFVAEENNDDYLPDFGDALLGKKRPGIFLVDIPTLTVRLVVSPEPDGSVAYGQPVFTSPTTIVAVGYGALDDSRRTGLIYCQNRLARLFHFDLAAQTAGTPLTPAGRSVRSPRVGLGVLTYISNMQGGPHGSCAQLHLRRLPLSLSVCSDDVLVPTVFHASNSEFPGLYLDQLPSAPFLLVQGVPYIALTSGWRSRTVPLLVSLDTKIVTNLAPCSTSGLVQPQALMSYHVFRTDGRSRILASRSCLNLADELVMYDLNDKAEWVSLAASPTQERMAQLTVGIITIPDVQATEIIVVTASPRVKHTLAERAVDPQANCVYAGVASTDIDAKNAAIPPGGGPYTTRRTAHAFEHGVVALLDKSTAITGYTVVLINFTGSTGFGQDAVNALFGRVGDVDVKSLHATYMYLIDANLVSPLARKQFIEGLSHGAYLTAQMTSQYPHLYHGAILRNPAIDLAAMFLHGSDIPEWGPNEVGLYQGQNDHAGLPIRLSAAEYEALAGASPIHHASAVTASTLVLLSADDRRVQPSQGLAWYHALKRGGRVTLGCKMFSGEVHAMDGVEAEWKAWKASLAWYESLAKWD